MDFIFKNLCIFVDTAWKFFHLSKSRILMWETTNYAYETSKIGHAKFDSMNFFCRIDLLWYILKSKVIITLIKNMKIPHNFQLRMIWFLWGVHGCHIICLSPILKGVNIFLHSLACCNHSYYEPPLSSHRVSTTTLKFLIFIIWNLKEVWKGVFSLLCYCQACPAPFKWPPTAKTSTDKRSKK